MSHTTELKNESKESVTYLRSPKGIREQCARITERVANGESPHFKLERSKLEKAAELVIQEFRSNYPDLDVPYHSRWRHFGDERLKMLNEKLSALDPDNAAKSRIELAIVSVLLDAGAGPTWRYKDPLTGKLVGRSEGLALASFDMFLDGGFASDPENPLMVDNPALRSITKRDLEKYFQVTPQNRLLGLDGRLHLLHKLEHSISVNKKYFGDIEPRLGNAYDYLVGHAGNNKLPARKVLSVVLEGLGNIWPGRASLGGVMLGDVWHHAALPATDHGHGLVPFHKLSQWLTYSLVEPLEDAGLEIGGLDELTGLAEYRNGGLLMDTGVISAKASDLTSKTHKADSEVIIEWRALTISLLDELAIVIREKLGKSSTDLPLAKIMQGGTWSAGRKLAGSLRADAEPPIRLASDGTVF